MNLRRVDGAASRTQPDGMDIIYRLFNRQQGIEDPGIHHGKTDIFGQK
jgi:hypothetical protein